MHSTCQPSEAVRAIVFDGRSARPVPAWLTRGDDALIVESESGSAEAIPFERLRRGSDGAGSRTVLHRLDQADWRAISDDPLPDDWLAGIASLHRPNRATLATGAAATAALIALVAGLWLHGGRLLTWAAPLVPRSVTQPIGRAVVSQISMGTRRCDAPAGRAVLDRIAMRLRPTQGFVEPISISVIESPAVNAFAAPGGQIAIFSGLIARAESPDEFAGVLAHEIGHVQLRHPAKALIRQTGLSLAAQALGGNVGGLADMAILLQSTRGAEADADAEAIRLLATASISPAGLERFFARLESDERRNPRDGKESLLDRLADYAATHPSDRSRRAVMAEAAARAGITQPALTKIEWDALRAICKR